VFILKKVINNEQPQHGVTLFTIVTLHL